MVFRIHWSDCYIGEPYIAEIRDYAALATRVAQNAFGIDTALPVGHASTYRERAKQVMLYRDDLAKCVDEPFDGAPTLFIGRGRLRHIGVARPIANEVWILHADQSVGAVIR